MEEITFIKSVNHDRTGIQSNYCRTELRDKQGRKVEIVFSITVFNRGEQEAKTVIGYLSGFKYREYSNVISPVLAKIKKDSTASRTYYSEWDVASYEYISKIKILE